MWQLLTVLLLLYRHSSLFIYFYTRTQTNFFLTPLSSPLSSLTPLVLLSSFLLPPTLSFPPSLLSPPPPAGPLLFPLTLEGAVINVTSTVTGTFRTEIYQAYP